MNIMVLFSNRLINVGVIAWILAQGIKITRDFIKNKKFNKERISGAGGMPSSHAAVVTSVMLTAYFMQGFNSPIFALSFIFALIVMYDATGVRWSAGLHAQALNHIVEHLDESDEKHNLQKLIPTLNESIGHKMIEVVCGALLGALIAVVSQLIVHAR